MSRLPFKKKTPRKYVLSDWNRRDEKLMLAVEKGQVDRVHHLITRKQVSPFKIDPKRQITALHRSALDGRVEFVQLILRDGNGSLNTKDLLGRTALHCAVQKAQYDVTKRLLEHGADVLVVDHEGRSSLHHACIGGHLGCIQLLLSKSSPVYLKDKDGICPLSLAASRGQATICRILLENGADVNDVDNKNRTPLMMASEQGHTALCEYLLTKGAVVELADKEGHDALWYAVQNKHRDVVKVLHKKTIPTSSTAPRGPGPRSSRDKVVEEWPLTDHAYEAVTELSDEGPEVAKTPSSSSTRQTEVTPPGSTGSRARLPSPCVEPPSPDQLSQPDEDTCNEYSRIEELDPDTGNEEEQSEDARSKIRFAGGSSFRSFVDEAFGLNGLSEPLKVRDSSQVRLQFPAEDSTIAAAGTSAPEVDPETPVVGESDVNIRRFMTESDVTTDDPVDLGQGQKVMAPSDDALDSDVTAAKEIVESLIRDAVRTVATVPEGAGGTLVLAEVHSDAKSKELAEERSVDLDLVNNNKAMVVQTEGISKSRASNGEPIRDRRLSSPEPEITDVRTSDWPPFSQLITSESDLKDLFQHISDLEGENSTLRRELDSVHQDRSVLEKTKEEVERKLSLAINRQHWIHEELLQMSLFLGGMKQRLTIDKPKEEILQRAEEDVETLERLLSALINLRVESIQDVDIYASLDDLRRSTDPGDEVHLAAAVARLERENKALLFQLRQAIGENQQLQAQMEEVEKFVNIARELKEENEALIAEYRRFRDIQEQEVSGMDELAQLFRETLEENKDLQTENESLKVKVLELQSLLDSKEAGAESNRNAEGDVDKLLTENSELRQEIAELTEAVNRESQTILEMDERLREYSSTQTARSGSQECSPREKEPYKSLEVDLEEFHRLREMYDELKEQTVELLKELEEKRESHVELERISEEFEEQGTEIVHLRATLDKKQSEVRRLLDEGDKQKRELERIIGDLKRDHERETKEQKQELKRVLEENHQLKLFVEDLGRAEIEQSQAQGQQGALSKDGVKTVQNSPHKTSIEVQVDNEDLVTGKMENVDGKTVVLEELQRSSALTNSLIEENTELKRQIEEVNEDNRRYRSLLSEEQNKRDEKAEMERLKSVNLDLQKEIKSLRRTIDEQSLYLLQMEQNGNRLHSTGFPPPPDAPMTSEHIEEDKEHSTRTKNTELVQFGSEAVYAKRSPRSNRRYVQEFGVGEMQHTSGEGGNGVGLSLEVQVDEPGEPEEEDFADSNFGGRVISPSQVTCLTEIQTGESEHAKKPLKKTLKENGVRKALSGGTGKRITWESDRVSILSKQNGDMARIGAEIEEQTEGEHDTSGHLEQELERKEERIKQLEDTAEELMVEMERRDNLEKECESIIDDYKALIRDFERCKSLFDLETKPDGTAFGELRNWLEKYQVDERCHRRLNEERLRLEKDLANIKTNIVEQEKDRIDELVSLDRQKTELEAEVTRLNDELRRKESESLDHLEKTGALQSEKEELENQRSDLSAQLEDLSASSSRLSREVESLRADNETLKDLLESKSPQLDSEYEEQLLTELEHLSETKEQLEKQLKEKDFELEETRDELLEQLDTLRSKMETDHRKVERDYSEMMDEQENLLDENRRLQAKVIVLERDITDVQEMYDEEKQALEKSRDLLEEEINRLKADRQNKVDSETDLAELCDDLTRKVDHLDEELKKVTLQRNQAVSQCQTFEVNHSDLEKKHKELADRIYQLQLENESLSSTVEREKNSIHDMNRTLTEQLEKLREENERLVKEKEKLGLILEMEKLKNFSSDLHSLPTSGTPEIDLPDGGKNGAHQPTEEENEMEHQIQLLRSNNRKLALEVAELHYQFSQILLSPSDGANGNDPKGHLIRNRDMVQQILRDFARENLRHLQVMLEAEEKCDHLKTEMEKNPAGNHLELGTHALEESSSPGEHLLEVLRQENTKLKDFMATLERLMALKSPLESPDLSFVSPVPVVHPGKSVASGIDATHGSEIQDSGISGNHLSPPSKTEDSSSVIRVFQLQRKLQENDRKYKDIICAYRRHLLSSVQGTIDPEVRDALLRIVDLRRRDSDL